MHGLINRSIEGFLRHTYGDSFWHDVAGASGIDARGFQTIRNYPDAVSFGLVNQAALRLDKPEAELLEDLGAWLAAREPLRRLLRFSGRDFADFLFSLEEWPGRAHMVIPDLGMPRIRIEPKSGDELRVVMPDCFPEWRSVMAGLIRAMADDYGALGLIAVEGNGVRVQISDDAFAEGRAFELAAFPAPEVAR
ncbi:MAG: heme NO-binding domain-containing protein [Paracoccus sp. (in: a-proteobacteria)]|uniref:heme NO-binding domain-containing protein n=1 Tax=Paracoccus sp. TaxID=267 RepID=UPI0026DEB6CF|nr:heme NO-binding domain-containing protein [Paracoccus sp. (in: a-proteobacteria)]MDO5614279.1 heme NO-binding domain-containing protein [Paracoccus sp. (in: a-proteobacteria)]